VARCGLPSGATTAGATTADHHGLLPGPGATSERRRGSTAQTGERSIDWYSTDLPTNCDDWQEEIRGRYQAIGRYLRPDRFGVRRLNVLTRRARPIALPGMALIDGRTYDLVILCTGNQDTYIDGLDFGSFGEYELADGTVVARQHDNLPAFRIGPHARLPFTQRELEDGIADIAANAVSMFRTATKTAALAATLRPV
jgi:hypothetical protein